MPIYEYQCASCGTRSEHLMRLSDPDPKECPGCDRPQLSRMLSAPQFRLAGGGWYETDFKGDKDRKRNLAGSEGGSGGDGGSSGGGADSKASDSKPATDSKAATPAPAASAPAASTSATGSAAKTASSGS